MRISLDIRKGLEENAASYFEKAKKDKRKLEGTRKIISEYEKKLIAAEAELSEKKSIAKHAVKREWYEKFRWFISSEGFLVIGGKDATTNEIIIKKHADKEDVVFHTDMAGSPFVVVKKEGKDGEIPKTTLDEAASFTAAHSRGWKLGMATLNVFYAHPEQVTKTTNSGESLSRGAFYIKGSVTNFSPKMEYAVGMLDDGRVMGGPISAVKKHCIKFAEVVQGDEKTSDAAKQIQKLIGGELDEIIRALPQGCKVKK
jgi:predicted ribosome quality control (RQC) complex YloA/Tae2 family protein